MKKKYRDITVNGVKYAWSYNDRSGYGHTVKSFVTIWKNKKMIMQNDIEHHKVTPKIVSDMIETYNKNIILPKNRISFTDLEVTKI